jgi:hypothetical protein
MAKERPENYHKDYQRMCRVVIYTTPVIKKLIEIDSIKEGSVSNVGDKIFNCHYKFTK